MGKQIVASSAVKMEAASLISELFASDKDMLAVPSTKALFLSKKGIVEGFLNLEELNQSDSERMGRVFILQKK